MQFYGGQSFMNANNIINNNNYSARTELEPGSSSSQRDDDEWLTLRGSGQRLRRIDMCDVLVLREVSSETHRVSVKLKSTNPFRNRVKSIVKIRKRTQSAEIVPGFGDRRFTVVSLEPEDDGDVERIQRVLEPLYETALSQRRVCLTQLFGVGRSMTPTLIYHDEVVDGWTFIGQYEKTPIVGTYLLYRFVNSFIDVLDDGTLQKLSTPVSTETGWTFNLRTRSFQYDIISSALSDEDEELCFDRLLPLPRNCNPLLDSNEIVRALPDFLQLLSSCASNTSRNPPHHNILTFGTVVDHTNPGILAYFPSVPSPVWSCEAPIGTHNVVAKYSKSVPSLVDLTFVKNDNKWNLNVQFSLRLPEDYCQRFRTAFLAQLFTHRTGDPEDLIFVNETAFELQGTFTSDLSSCNPPKYLHVPSLSPEWIDNMPCLRWPPNPRIFYWSFDRRGRMVIPEEDWEKYGIPNLEVETFVGSMWYNDKYQAVAEYFHLTKYDLGGQQFADDHGYPILVKGDPHAAEIQTPRNTITSGKLEKAIKEFGKGKQSKAPEPNSHIEFQAGRIEQASIIEISD
ncbi:hypothetical protein E1B28_010490 [Marasmius oreades]|uniref:Uncharacterized protein n=1 Tax=Marasmius oreades TaxID=181124 RepID=A0A9P7USR6_9AGAR|nr:uncharacterized protein E1B28_010490 [Marasmius oreades]KAG7091456.1 hypothetical protein E1B28_010490 [Marasmius oreades]